MSTDSNILAVDVARDRMAIAERPSERAIDIVSPRIGTGAWNAIDAIEREWAEIPQIEMRLNHIFTPVPNEEGLFIYTRTIFMLAGERYTTLVHLYDSPFVIASGVVEVIDGESQHQIFRAPHVGVTKAGTRRALYIHEDCTWVAHFVTRETTPDAIGAQLTFDPTTLGHLDDIPKETLEFIRNNHRINKTQMLSLNKFSLSDDEGSLLN